MATVGRFALLSAAASGKTRRAAPARSSGCQPRKMLRCWEMLRCWPEPSGSAGEALRFACNLRYRTIDRALFGALRRTTSDMTDTIDLALLETLRAQLSAIDAGTPAEDVLSPADLPFTLRVARLAVALADAELLRKLEVRYARMLLDLISGEDVTISRAAELTGISVADLRRWSSACLKSGTVDAAPFPVKEQRG